MRVIQYSRGGSDSSRGCGVLDRPPSRAMTAECAVTALPLPTGHASPFSRRHLRPSYSNISPSQYRGRREGRVLTAPMARLQKKRRRQSPQVRAEQPGLPCAMVYRLIRDLPGDRLSCPRHLKKRAKRISGNLTPAPGCQDHTTSPSVPAPLVECRLHVHRSPHSTYRDDAYAPLR
jgi:hypothetical protein